MGSKKLKKLHDYSDYGDIFALTDVKVLYIPQKEFKRIPKDELSALSSIFKERNMSLEYRICQKYNIPFKDFICY